MTPESIAVLQADPALAGALSGLRATAATRDLRARTLGVRGGRWDPDELAAGLEGGIGLLVLEGVVARRVGTARRSGAELLGPGDLLRPTSASRRSPDAGFASTWRVIDPLRIAVLDQRFLMRLAPYPEIANELIGRAVDRSRHALVHLAIAHHPRVESRLLHLLWQLADRWGRDTADGVLLPLRLTHELLADLVAAQRPSVTLSLQRLERQGDIKRASGRVVLVRRPSSVASSDISDALAG